jgi:hypothetical protein
VHMHVCVLTTGHLFNCLYCLIAAMQVGNVNSPFSFCVVTIER